jgi:hypothetical protein
MISGHAGGLCIAASGTTRFQDLCPAGATDLDHYRLITWLENSSFRFLRDIQPVCTDLDVATK